MPDFTARPLDPGALVICGRCCALRGKIPDDDGAGQRCKCTPLEVRQQEPTWHRYDYNTYAELCRCCGLVLLKSGNRYSVWFCEPCKEAVVALNRAAGRCLIPIGRHSIMNGYRPRSHGGRKRPREGAALG